VLDDRMVMNKIVKHEHEGDGLTIYQIVNDEYLITKGRERRGEVGG
jgi:hypothetical protein